MIKQGIMIGTLLCMTALPFGGYVHAASTQTSIAVGQDVEGKAATKAETGKDEAPAGRTDKAASSEKETDTGLTAAKTAEKEKRHADEVQMEYLDGRFFKDRNVNVSNLHYFHKYKDLGNFSLHYGVTLSHATGYLTDKHDRRRDSDAWGIGPAYMVRYETKLSGKLYGGIDGSGSVLAYNKAHPWGGRAYGFLWRIGPRLAYHFDKDDDLSVSYIFHHSSNGFRDHNPGYNGIGFSVGFEHSF